MKNTLIWLVDAKYQVWNKILLEDESYVWVRPQQNDKMVSKIFEIFSKKKKIELLWSLASIQRVSSLRV